MSFTEREKQIIATGLANGKNASEIKTAVARERLGIKPLPKAPEQPTLMQNIGGAFRGGVELAAEGAKQAFGAGQKEGLGEQALSSAEGGMKMAQGIGRAVTSPIAGALAGTPVAEAVGNVVTPVLETAQQTLEPMIGERATENLGRAAELAGYITPGIVPTKGIVGKMSAMADNFDTPQVVASPLRTGAPASGLIETIAPEGGVLDRVSTNIQKKVRDWQDYQKLPEEIKTMDRYGIEKSVAEDILKNDSLKTIDIKERMLARAEQGLTKGTQAERPLIEAAPDVLDRIYLIEKERQALGMQMGKVAESVYGAGRINIRPIKQKLNDLLQDAGFAADDAKNIIFDSGSVKFGDATIKYLERLYNRVMSNADNVEGWQASNIDDYLREVKRLALHDADMGRAVPTFRSRMDGTQKNIINELVEAMYSDPALASSGIRGMRNKYRQLSELLDEADKAFSINDTLPEYSAAYIARSIADLTTNYKRGVEIERLFKQIDELYPSDVNLSSLARYNNFLNGVYGAAPGSLEGIAQRVAGKGSVRGAAGALADEVIGAAVGTLGKTPETVSKGLRSAFERIKNGKSIEDVPAPAPKKTSTKTPVDKEAKNAKTQTGGVIKAVKEALTKPQRGMVNFGAIADELTPAKKSSPAPKANQVASSVDNTPNAGGVKGDLSSSIKEAKAAGKSFEEWVNGEGTAVFHGTKHKFDVFEDKYLGQVTGSKSAREGYYFTTNREVADGYARFGDSAMADRLRVEAERLEAIARKTNRPSDWDAYDNAYAKYEDESLTPSDYSDRQVIEARLDIKNPLVVDFKNKRFIDEDYMKLLATAKKNKHDGLIIKNVSDAVETTYSLDYEPDSRLLGDIYVPFSSKQIKTRSQLKKEWDSTPQK